MRARVFQADLPFVAVVLVLVLGLVLTSRRCSAEVAAATVKLRKIDPRSGPAKLMSAHLSTAATSTDAFTTPVVDANTAAVAALRTAAVTGVGYCSAASGAGAGSSSRATW